MHFRKFIWVYRMFCQSFTDMKKNQFPNNKIVFEIFLSSSFISRSDWRNDL